MIELDHHKQQELCQTRPLYRQGRNLTAVKVYTVNNESRHILIFGVPKINLQPELKSLCTKYGQVNNMKLQTDLKTELFTECYQVTYDRIQSARAAKRLLDNRSFYGGVLHVCYAPEYETVEETRMKLIQRKKDIAFRLEKNNKFNNIHKRSDHIDTQTNPNYTQYSSSYTKSDFYNSYPINNDERNNSVQSVNSSERSVTGDEIASSAKKKKVESQPASNFNNRVVYGPSEECRQFTNSPDDNPLKCKTNPKRIIFFNKDR